MIICGFIEKLHKKEGKSKVELFSIYVEKNEKLLDTELFCILHRDK